jgi:antitoxin HigA-1
MTMFDPPHPGEIVREECLAPLGLSVAKAAERLGVSRQAVHNIISEKAGISREMALRLEKAFGPEAGFWNRLQSAYRLAAARKHKRLDSI